MLDIPRASGGVELTAKQMFMLFPTPMFTGKLSDISLCDRIEKKVRELQKSGKGTSSPEGMILADMTPDDIHTLPEMKELVAVIISESGYILDAFRIKRDSHYVTNMWANIANPNRRHHMHMHPNCPVERPRLYQDAEAMRVDDLHFAAPVFEKYRARIYRQERVQFGRFFHAGGERPDVDLAEPRSAYGRAGRGRRIRGSDRRRFQHHDPRTHPNAHGASRLALTND
jgi:hypothetical protein